MKEIVVLSGKGGTGKTTVTGSLAALVDKKVLVDCDVDAADLHLLLAPELWEESEFRSGRTAVIDDDICTGCGTCEKACRFGAINREGIIAYSCEGCGLCARVCPAGAITMKENLSGHWYVSGTRFGTLVHARLGIGEENSGKLVTTVRSAARDIAVRDGLDLIISDGPPGTGCPVISSLSGADLALIVTEPTLSGIHDLERVLGVCGHFNVPAIVAINKYDINEENTKFIQTYCYNKDVSVAARVPFDTAVIESTAKGVPLVEYSNGSAAAELRKLWDNIVTSRSPETGEMENAGPH